MLVPNLLSSPRLQLALGSGLRGVGMSSAALLLVAATAAPSSPVEETPEAREQARLCETLDEREGIAACRAALALGLGPERRAPVREMLAKHLVDVERWSELAEHYREDVRLAPEVAGAWFRLGSTLLFALNESPEALAALEEATRLDPKDAETRCLLAIALHSLGRYQEATAAFDEALRLDPAVLDGRPAAQAVRDAARRAEPWP
jgi:tetratricopeptide (TPR) repeat protein